jgi:hypothetical protein
VRRLTGIRSVLALTVALAWMGPGAIARGQDAAVSNGDEEQGSAGGRFKVLTTPEALDKLDRLGKEKLRPPIEFFRTQFPPFNILPYVKARHWSTVILDLRSNYTGYDGRLQTAPIPMEDMPHEMIFRREARLLKDQEVHLGWQIMLPSIPKELSLELERPDAIRADDTVPATVKALEPHQMLVLILSKNPNDYGHWMKFRALLPTSGDKDPRSIDKQRYYKLVIPDEADKPLLSPHPLTWTTISHAIWDGLEPESLNPGQQQAMLDWLHWGGQLILVGGAAPSFAPLQDSFLGPYLPADPAGENRLLNEADLTPISRAFPPPESPGEQEYRDATPYGAPYLVRRYGKPEPIHPAPNRPVFFGGLRAREGVGAVEIPFEEGDDRLLGVERRVGRGRILMLSFTPTDPALASWPGIDTLVQRLILRRPEESLQVSKPDPIVGSKTTTSSWLYRCLSGPDLSWVRFVSRDLGSRASSIPQSLEPGEVVLPREPVAEWSDRSALPSVAIEALKQASGITIPPSSFILKVIIAYVVALVPLNWLICRYVIRRREWAWAVVPLLSLGFAIGVERAAAYDMGFDSGCDEVDVLETYDSYPRAHLSRFAALFSTGRVRYTISYPNDPSALALPMNSGMALRGEDVAQSAWQSLPVPALVGLQVQPRSLQLFRSEQMSPLSGTIDLVTDKGPRRIVNGTALELRDAVLVEDDGNRRTPLGTIKPGESVDLSQLDEGRVDEAPGAPSWLNLVPFLEPLRHFAWHEPENLGEIRLVAWSSSLLPGQKIEPAVDRHRGVTMVCAHLRMGPSPSFKTHRYNDLAPPDPAEANRLPDRRFSNTPGAPAASGTIISIRPRSAAGSLPPFGSTMPPQP